MQDKGVISEARSEARFEGNFEWTWGKKGPWWQFKSQEIVITEEYTYWWRGDVELIIPKGFVSDGYSIPLIVQLLSLNQLTNYMHGLKASVVHDYVCKELLLTSDERVEVFREATRVSKVNKYNRTILTFGVILGTYLGYCA